MLITSMLLMMSAAAEPAEATEQPDPNEIICRRTAVVTSRIPERICRTRAYWAVIEEQNQQHSLHMRRTVGGTGNFGEGPITTVGPARGGQ